MTIESLYEGYLEADENKRKIAEKICDKEKSIARLKKQVKRLEDMQYGKSWIQTLVIPLAKLLTPLLDCESFEILGPFGLRAETSIFFKKANSTAQYCDYSLSVTLHIEHNEIDIDEMINKKLEKKIENIDLEPLLTSLIEDYIDEELDGLDIEDDVLTAIQDEFD